MIFDQMRLFMNTWPRVFLTCCKELMKTKSNQLSTV